MPGSDLISPSEDSTHDPSRGLASPPEAWRPQTLGSAAFQKSPNLQAAWLWEALTCAKPSFWVLEIQQGPQTPFSGSS